MNFDTAFDRLMGHEGGYSNNPADPGGETMFGVTARVARAEGYYGAMKDLPRETAKRIAKTCYWDRAHCDLLPGPVAFQFMDTVYNSGYGNAARILQRAVGVADDGAIGPLTIKAMQALTVTDLLMLFNAERLLFLSNLSTWADFGKGWARRIAANLRFAAEDA